MVDIRSKLIGKPDPFLDLLKQVGFLPVRIPRADIEPLGLVSRSGKELNLLGDVAQALETGEAAKPHTVADIRTAAAVQQTQTTQMTRGAGLSFLGNIIQSLSGKSCEIESAFKRAATIAMEFAGVSIDRIDVVMLDRYLSRASIHPDCRAIREQLTKDECGIITAVMKCRRYVVSAAQQDGSEVSLEVPLLQQAVGAQVRVSAVNQSQSKVAYEGRVPLVFGIQAVRLFYDRKGRFTAFDPMAPGSAMMRGLSAPVRVPQLFPMEETFVQLAA